MGPESSPPNSTCTTVPGAWLRDTLRGILSFSSIWQQVKLKRWTLTNTLSTERRTEKEPIYTSSPCAFRWSSIAHPTLVTISRGERVNYKERRTFPHLLAEASASESLLPSPGGAAKEGRTFTSTMADNCTRSMFAKSSTRFHITRAYVNFSNLA